MSQAKYLVNINLMGSSIKSTARYWAFQAIARVEGDNAYTDLVLSSLLDKSRNFTKDQAAINEIVKGVITWKLLLDWIAKSFLNKPESIPQDIIWLLWLGIYQIKFLNTPDFAAVNETVELAKALRLHKWTRLINAVLRNTIRNANSIQLPDKEKDPVRFLSVSQSHPEWLIEHWLDEFGFKKTESLCIANNKVPNVSIRINPVKTSGEHVERILQENQFSYKKSKLPGFYRIAQMDSAIFRGMINDGLITVQDESAALVSLLVDPQPQSVIFDLCAAPGGKTTHLAELSKDAAVIVAGDLNHARAGLVRKTANRLGVNSINTLISDALHFPAKEADCVLVDAPCSGLGVLRKKPDLRWNKTNTDISLLNVIQKNILQHAAQLVKNGGTLVYSTCTIEKKENENIIFDFLEKNPNFGIQNLETNALLNRFLTKDKMIRTWPDRDNMDGSFSVKLKKIKGI